MKCNLCEKEVSYANRFAASQQGWRFVEVHISGGAKYGVFCPEETKPRVLEAIKKLLDGEKK
jgi:hypothetical protein